MRRVLTFLLMFLISIQISLALNLTVNINPDQQSILPKEIAQFDLKLSHDSKESEFFDVFSPDIIWDIRAAKSLLVSSGEQFSSKISIRPINLNPGFYSAPIIIRHPTTNTQKKFFLGIEITADPQNKETYVPALKGSAEISKLIDPRDPLKLTVRIENLNNKDITKLDVKVRSNSINLDTQTSLQGLEKKILNIDINLNQKTPPSKDTLKVTLFGFDKDRNKEYQFDLSPMEFEIMPYGDIEQHIDIKTQFMKSTKTITLENTGNTKKRSEPKIKKSFFKDAFTSFSIEPAVKEGYYVWIVDLNINEKQDIIVTTNYWPLFIAIILALAATTAYLIFRSPIIIRKTAKIISTKEGGISELKIILHVKNRSKKRIHNVRVIDLIPNIAEIVKEFELGTLEPNKIMLHDNKGTIAKWILDNIEPQEERLITYKIKNKLSVLEGIDLPPAVIKFEVTPESERSTKSNSFTLKF